MRRRWRYGCWRVAVTGHLPVQIVTSLFYLTPAVTALMAWLMFGERLGVLALVGMGVCVTGVFLVNWRTR